MTDEIFQLQAADALHCGEFTATPLGALVSAMLEGKPAALANRASEVDVINGGVVATLELVADALENGETVDADRIGGVADCLRLMASLSAFCIAANNCIQAAETARRYCAKNPEKAQ